MTVRWRGQTAAYTTAERLLMADLPVREQALVHTLKALTDGEVSESNRADTVAPGGASLGEMIGNTQRLDAQRHPQRLDQPLRGHGEGAGIDPPVDRAAILFTDPEDIPFGAPKARAKIYAVVWTGGNHRRCKTKDGAKDSRSATKTIKTWLRWYERQGWKVTFGSQAAGWYIATNEKGDRHAISLHEYDRDTKERLS